MTARVNGIALESMQEPTRAALSRYGEMTDGRLAFDLDAAVRLELTLNKPNSARSATTFQHLGEAAGTLYVIVFAPGDGTGDESTYKLDESLTTVELPRSPRMIPRSKAGIHSEAHLTIASYSTDEPDPEPRLFAGNLHVIEIGDDGYSRELYTRGRIGQDEGDFQYVMVGEQDARPTTTYTTGYDERYERYGDPHSIYSHHPRIVQVCAFMAIDEQLARQNPFHGLGAEQYTDIGVY